MLRTIIIAATLAAALHPAAAELASGSRFEPSPLQRLLAVSGGEYRVAQRASCKAASTCEEAVRMWCGGYAGADRDKDGIPCESVCSSKAQVDQIKERIGC
jgi:hypothetical protein